MEIQQEEFENYRKGCTFDEIDSKSLNEDQVNLFRSIPMHIKVLPFGVEII